MTKKRSTPKKAIAPQSSSETTKAPQEFGMPRTGFDDEGARGHGAQVVMGAAGPQAPANPHPGIH